MAAGGGDNSTAVGSCNEKMARLGAELGQTIRQRLTAILLLRKCTTKKAEIAKDSLFITSSFMA